jgi:hypothetical protein
MAIRSAIRRLLPTPLLRLVRRLRHGRHHELKVFTAGLLPLPVYRELTAVVAAAPRGRDIIEVGGAAGTATISMAWGLDPVPGGGGRIVVVEKCEGGTRTPYGGWEENRARFERFVRDYGVADRVILYPHYLTLENGAEVRSLVERRPLAGLLCDADGWVHRDLFLFGELLAADSFVVIDDYHPHFSPKHEVTFAVVNRLIEEGVFVPRKLVDETSFGAIGRPMTRELHDECEGIARNVCRRLGVVFDIRGMSPAEPPPAG